MLSKSISNIFAFSASAAFRAAFPKLVARDFFYSPTTAFTQPKGGPMLVKSNILADRPFPKFLTRDVFDRHDGNLYKELRYINQVHAVKEGQ